MRAESDEDSVKHANAPVFHTQRARKPRTAYGETYAAALFDSRLWLLQNYAASADAFIYFSVDERVANTHDDRK